MPLMPLTSPAAVSDDHNAWRRLLVALALATVGGIGLWSSVVVLPSIQAYFGLDRSGAALPYTATLIGFALGGIGFGRLIDRFGIAGPALVGSLLLGGGYLAAAAAASYWQFVAAQALLIGVGSSAFFGPLVADISLWFVKRRGLAVALVASGNYLAGALWPPLLQWGLASQGWRLTHVWVGMICLLALPPLALLLRRRPSCGSVERGAAPGTGRFAMPAAPALTQMLLVLAGVACCVAMSMPQVHIVAYCVDLGYGPARGAEMLSLMLGLGVVSRVVSGLIADRIGGLGALLLGSLLQCLALLFYLPSDALMSLYLVAALFGLAQGGIVPSYALIVRDYFPAREAGFRVSLVLMATVFGMALGGWLSGEIYDWTRSYRAAFVNGIAFNLLNTSIALWLLSRRLRPHLGLQPYPAETGQFQRRAQQIDADG